MSAEKMSEMLDMNQLSALMERMKQLGIRKLEYTTADGKKIAFQQGDEQSFVPLTVPPNRVIEPAHTAQQICATMHGVFYLANTPGEAPFVSVGDEVREGQVIGILEAMKTLTRVEADYDCRILDVLVKDATTVAPGTPLFHVEAING